MRELSAAAQRRLERRSFFVLGGLILFGVVFIGMATWLGQQDRLIYRITPDPPLPPTEARVSGLLRTRKPWVLRAVDDVRLHEEQAAAIRSVTSQFSGNPGFEFRDGASVLAPIRETCPHPNLGFNTALLLMLAGEDEKALQALDGTISPQDAEAWLLQGLIFERLSQFKEAEHALRRCLAVEAGSVDGLIALARTLLFLRRPLEALPLADQAVRSAPGSADARLILAEACLANSDSGRARRAFLDVLQIRPHDAYAESQARRIDGTK